VPEAAEAEQALLLALVLNPAASVPGLERPGPSAQYQARSRDDGLQRVLTTEPASPALVAAFARSGLVLAPEQPTRLANCLRPS
jgi:hypothetical protein